MERENFFILLELPFDPPVEDIAQIKATLNLKQQEWARLHNSPQTRSIALQYMELIPEIERVLTDPLTRANEAEQAAKIRQQKMIPFEAELRVLEGKNYIMPREIKDITDKYRPYGITRDTIMGFIDVPITDTPPKTPVEKTVKAINQEMVKTIRDHLNVLGEENLYSFLSLPKHASVKDLIAVAKEQYHIAFHSEEKTGKTTAVQLLSETAIQVFADDASKAAYDSYLSVSHYPELNTLIDEEFYRSGYISPDMLIRLVNFGVTSYDTTILNLEEYVRRYCRAYDIPVDMQEPYITCPNCDQHSPRGTVFCVHCAAPLEGKCPQCGTFFSDGASVCSKCSFPIGDMGKAIPYIEQVESSLNDNNWSSAQHGLNYIQLYWPIHPKYEALKQKTEAVEQRYYDTLGSIEEAIKENRFYAAQELTSKAQSRNIVIPKDTLNLINTTIDDFANELAQLKQQDHASYDSLHILLGKVTDSLELDRMLSQYPPEPPTRITARPNKNIVQINWSASPSSGLLKYVVVRKENSVSLTAYDGDVVYDGDENSFIDSNIPPLRNFFYSVFVKRGNSFSQMGAVAAASVKIIPDLLDFKIVPGDGAAQISWTPPPHLHSVKIWRKLGGDRPTSPNEGKLLETTRLDGFSDMKLKNDVEYWYYAVSVFRTIEGDTLESEGVCSSVIPHELITPIDQFEVTAVEGEENLYLAVWQGAPRDEILIFSSKARPHHYLGQIVPTDELLYEYNRLQLDNQTSYSAKFRLNLEGGTYISPVAVSSRFGTMGLPFYLTNVPCVSNIGYNIVDSDLILNFDWPEGYDRSVVMAWRKDDFPTSITQKNTLSLECSKKQYDNDSGAKLPEIATGRYFINIYTTFISPEDKIIYSPPQRIIVDNTPAIEFFYDIVTKKTLFSKAVTVTVTLRTDTEFDIPRALIVGKVDHLPLSITDGIPLFEMSREQNITKTITYEYKTENLPKEIFMRLFFYDEAEYQRLRPLPAKSLIVTI